jgi:hypothetical protein
MKSFGLAVLAAACAAAIPAFAQTAAPGSVPTAPVPSTTAPSTTVPSSPGSITGSNPSFGTSMPSFGNTNPSFGTPPAGTTGGIADSNNSVATQAQQRRQLALQQCRAMSSSAQTDCVRAADDAFAREMGSAALAQGGAATGAAGAPEVARSPRTTPDVSPMPRDSTGR